MGLPAIYESAEEFLFADVDEMAKAGLPQVTIKHIIRIRDSYIYWLNYPRKQDKDIIQRLMQFDGIQKSQAHQDLKVIKNLLGSFQKVSKDYHRYRASVGILDGIEKAYATNKAEAIIKGWAEYGKIHQLDKPDDEDNRTDVPFQPFKPTDDPTVAGLKPLVNAREKIRKMKEKYFSEEIQDIEFEPIEFNEDDIFKPKLKDGGSIAESLPK